ncbi:hypothetical protein BC835DRAFT_1410840 [Cytidiella melzeri]|nr:hypothetical protein BC835DRAFT_1410840 [Cytidiella melzeri]
MDGHYVGPIPPADFMKEFMPISDEEVERLPKNVNAGTEAEGVFSDWDHAVEEVELSASQAHRYFPPGTWQFKSIALLRDPRKTHEPLDDFRVRPLGPSPRGVTPFSPYH